MPRKYSPDEKAQTLAVLEANRGNVKHTGLNLDIPRSTVSLWKHSEQPPEIIELKEQKKAELADSLLELAAKIVHAIPAKLGDAPVDKLATALGITIDKWLLITGQATSRNEHNVRQLPPLPDDRLDDILRNG